MIRIEMTISDWDDIESQLAGESDDAEVRALEAERVAFLGETEVRCECAPSPGRAQYTTVNGLPCPKHADAAEWAARR